MTQIPDWNSQGLVPPIQPGASGHSLDRSPYEASSLDVVARFATTIERCAILTGWLAYRKALYESGLESGFQWLDGSFLEDVESKDVPRVPGDVDVVTFFELPEGLSQVEYDEKHAELFNPKAMKAAYFVDAYGVQLGYALDGELVSEIAYWYSLWSHRKLDHVWKGFVQVELSPLTDSTAIARLADQARKWENEH